MMLFKLKMTLTTATLVLPLMIMVSSMHAATVSLSATAPTGGAGSISNFTGAAQDRNNIGGDGANDGAGNDASTYIAFDRAAQGQSFTTGTAAPGYTLSALTLQMVGYTSNTDTTYYNTSGPGTFTIRVGTLGGSTFSQIASETATLSGGPSGNSANGAGQFITFTFATPVTLTASTTYGFDVGTSTNGFFFETLGIRDAAAGGNPYANGTAYNTGSSGVADQTAVNLLAGDRVFQADITAVPEPSTAVGGVLLIGALGWFQYRRLRLGMRA